MQCGCVNILTLASRHLTPAHQHQKEKEEEEKEEEEEEEEEKRRRKNGLHT